MCIPSSIWMLEFSFRGDAAGRLQLEHAGTGIEKIVEQSLRQVSPDQAPLFAWPVVCGSAVAERTRALTFESGILRVEVSDAGWKSELQALAPRYLAVINRYTTEAVRRIEFVIGSLVEDKTKR
jgi:hypothetical protein